MHCFVSPPTNMWLSVTIIKFRVIVQSAWDTVIYVCHLYPQYLSVVGWNKRGSEEKVDKCFCVMETPSLALSVSRSFSFSLLGQFLLPATVWEERGLAGWLATSWLVWVAAQALFPCQFEAGFFPYLTLPLSPTSQLSPYLSTVPQSQLELCKHNTWSLKISWYFSSTFYHVIVHSCSIFLFINYIFTCFIVNKC